MDLRRYELATLAAARRLRSSYCCLAHGTVLLERFDEPVLEIARDHRSANLSELDVAVMDLAERVVDDATSIGDADTQRLRDLGTLQTEIMDVVLAASARCFFSKTLDALGVLPDASYRDARARVARCARRRQADRRGVGQAPATPSAVAISAIAARSASLAPSSLPRSRWASATLFASPSVKRL